MDNQPTQNLSLAPFEYHQKLKAHFKSRKKTWDWFTNQSTKIKQVEEFKTNLLKNTYRLDREAHQELYAIVDDTCQKLHIDANVTLYQQNNSVQLNAGISIINQEAHIVFSGNLISLLSKDEMQALIAHELSHYLFYKIDSEEYETTQRIILALANDSNSENAMIETARIFQLYLELFCDAGALMVCDDYQVVIRTLVKLETNLQNVNAESYLIQAKEIILADDKNTTSVSHPESYIRSLALLYRHEKSTKYQETIQQLIEGPLDLNQLDIFKQQELRALTQDFLQIIIKPSWMNTGTILNLCNQYFPGFNKKQDSDTKELTQKIELSRPNVKNYLSYVLLDFAKVDSDLENVALAHTFEIAELLNLKANYEKIVRKELKISVREFKILKEKTAAALSNISETKEDSIYND